MPDNTAGGKVFEHSCGENGARIAGQHKSERSQISGPCEIGSATVKLKHVYLTASEPEVLAGFYEALGMTIRFADRGRWVQFAGDKAALCVAGPAESVSEPSRNAVLVFEVDDLDIALERARAQGAEVFCEVRDMGAHGRVAHFRDPQHNTIQLFQAAAG
jgi:predicted enzyme related to lactoylglutathione lyase